MKMEKKINVPPYNSRYLQTTVSENNQNSKNSFSCIILIAQGRQYDRESCYTKIQEIGRERDVIGELGD